MGRTVAEVRRSALERWWDREWPVIVLGIDPGRSAGVALVESRPATGTIRLRWAREVDSYSLAVERAILDAYEYAEAREWPLVAAVEDWGAGGHRGLAQWVGLGEQRGIWLRAIYVEGVRRAARKVPIVKVPQTRWRSRLCKTSGERANGEFHRFDSDRWKYEAYQAARRLFHGVESGELGLGENASEAACIGYFGARADGTGKALGKRWLADNGLSFESLEPLIHPKSKRGRAAK